MNLGCLSRAGAVVVGFALLLVALLVATPAQAQSKGWHIKRYDVTVDVDASGTMDVSIDMDYSFGHTPGHGPYISLPRRMGYSEDFDRLYEIDQITASSSTGAPAFVHPQWSTNEVQIRVGDEDRGDISGVHQYTISYRMEGMLNPSAGGGPYDELYWNVIGSGWEIPIADLSVTVNGPDGIADVLCFAGRSGSTNMCAQAQGSGGTAYFEHDAVPVGEQLTIAVGWPAGTFPGLQPMLVKRPHVADPVNAASPAGLLGGLLALGGVAGALTLLGRRGRDEAYLGLTPGLAPGLGEVPQIGKRSSRAPIAVQFQPPADLRPGVIGTLYDEVADPVDVTATLVDLAVRGYLEIEEVPRSNPKKKPKSWLLIKTRKLDPTLAPFERTLLTGLFSGRDSVTTRELSETFSHIQRKVRDQLYDEVTGRGWFHTSPAVVRQRWYSVGGALLFLAFLLFFVAFGWQSGPDGLLFIPLALVVVAIAAFAGAKRAPARTAEGTAVLAQTLGFKQYLSTAEADQLRWEEGEDLFSRYLPFAIAFRETGHWAKVFADLAASGRQVPEPSWYGASTGSVWTSGVDFSSRFASFASTATTSMSSTPASSSSGSSGGSGFSGGSSGGGGGGGGGGGW